MANPGFWSFPIHPDNAGLLLAHPSRPTELSILNHSAAFLWSLLLNQPHVDPIPTFAAHFGISLEQSAADIAQTLDDWSQSLLVPQNDHDAKLLPAPLPTPPSPDNSPGQNRTSIEFSIGAITFRLRSYNPDFSEEIRPRLAHLESAAPPDAPDHTFVVTESLEIFHNNHFLHSAPDPAAARILLLPEIARLAHSNPAISWLAILHAAVLAHPLTNDALLLAAPTHSGKSTLTAALAHSGLRLLSDDSAALVWGVENKRGHCGLASTGAPAPSSLTTPLPNNPECRTEPRASASGPTPQPPSSSDPENKRGHCGVASTKSSNVGSHEAAVSPFVLPGADSNLSAPCPLALSLPFSLMLRAGSWPILADMYPELSTSPIHHRYGEPVRFLTPPSTGTTPAVPKHLVFVNYQPNAVITSLEPLSTLQAFLNLQNSGFWVPHTQPTLSAFTNWVHSIPAFQLTYSNLSESIAVLHKLLGFSR